MARATLAVPLGARFLVASRAMFIVSGLFSFLPFVVFAIGIVWGLVTIRRHPRRSARALLGFGVLLVGNLVLWAVQRVFFNFFLGGAALTAYGPWLFRLGYFLVTAVGLGLLVWSLFAGPRERAGVHAVQPGWAPPQGPYPPAQGQYPHPGPYGGQR